MVSTVREQDVIWKQYPEYPWIEANQFGEIRTTDHWVTDKNGYRRLIKGHILKQQLLPCGYMYVGFGVNGKTVNLRVHRVIATCFLPNPDNLPEVNHKDNDPTNNRLDNLEWCTREYNEAYKRNFGTSQAEISGQLFGHPVIAVNPETSDVFFVESQHEAERQLGANHSSIGRVINGKRHKAGGYWFCYADEKAVEKTREKFGDKVAKKVEELMVNELRLIN